MSEVGNVLDLLAKYILQLERRIMADMSALSNAVADNTDAVNQALARLDDLNRQIADLHAGSVDQAALDQLAAQISDATARLRSAVA